MDSVLVSLLLNLNTFSITLGALIFYLYVINFEQVLLCFYKELGSSVETNFSKTNYSRFPIILWPQFCIFVQFVCLLVFRLKQKWWEGEKICEREKINITMIWCLFMTLSGFNIQIQMQQFKTTFKSILLTLQFCHHYY